MKYFIDFDNTLCTTIDGDYINSTPLYERINKVKELKDQGHYIVIWTARGSRSNIDYRELTETQLLTWNIPYDELRMGKPDFDIMIDDKCHNVDIFWRIPDINNNISKKLKSEIVPKGWGKEIIFVNNDEYCGKILAGLFNKEPTYILNKNFEKNIFIN
jgi:hypothetical protein